MTVLDNAQLDVVRKVLMGEITHCDFTDKRAKIGITATHRAAAAIALLLVHREQSCWSDGHNQWLLHKPGINLTFEVLLSCDTRGGAIAASTKLKLHTCLPKSHDIALTPPNTLLALAQEFTPESPGVTAYMRAAKRAAGDEWLRWYQFPAQIASDDQLSDPSFALAVLAHLHGDAAKDRAAIINNLPNKEQKEMVATLLRTVLNAL